MNATPTKRGLDWPLMENNITRPDLDAVIDYLRGDDPILTNSANVRAFEDEWSRWIDWEREWQRANLAAIRRHPVTTARPLTDRVLGSVSRAYHDTATGSIIVAVRYPGQEAHIASIDIATGKFTRWTSATTTSAPSSASSCAAAAPIPLAPPTTSARLPSNRNFSTPMAHPLASSLNPRQLTLSSACL